MQIEIHDVPRPCQTQICRTGRRRIATQARRVVKSAGFAQPVFTAPETFPVAVARLAADDTAAYSRTGGPTPKRVARLACKSRPISKGVTLAARTLRHRDDPVGARPTVVKPAHGSAALSLRKQPRASKRVERNRRSGALIKLGDSVKTRRVCRKTLGAVAACGFHLAASQQCFLKSKIHATFVVSIRAQLRAVGDTSSVLAQRYRRCAACFRILQHHVRFTKVVERDGISLLVFGHQTVFQTYAQCSVHGIPKEITRPSEPAPTKKSAMVVLLIVKTNTFQFVFAHLRTLAGTRNIRASYTDEYRPTRRVRVAATKPRILFVEGTVLDLHKIKVFYKHGLWSPVAERSARVFLPVTAPKNTLAIVRGVSARPMNDKVCFSV